MPAQPLLSPAEWKVVLELLERERKDLPAEIRRSDHTRFREELRERERLIDGLLERLRPAVAE